MSKHDWDTRGLLRDIEDPACVVVSTEDLVVIRDKFPKAKYHFLIAPLADIDSIFAVSDVEYNWLWFFDFNDWMFAIDS